MALLFDHSDDACTEAGETIDEHPISQAVSQSRPSRADDVKVVQQLLNAVPTAAGGPAQRLDVDGICGPKTNAAIVSYQNKNLGWNDGRVDPNGPTIKSLMKFVVDSPTVPYGPVSPEQQANGSSGGSNAVDGPTVVLYAHSIMRVLAPSINLMRWRLTRADKKFIAFMQKHFSSGHEQAKASDIPHLQKVLADIDVYVARANAFGILQMENVILYDPVASPTFVGRTTRGGNKMSTKQVQVYREAKTGKLIKSPGQSVWLSSSWANQITYEKHFTLLHEFAHFVGPRDGHSTIIEDYAYADQPKFLTLSKFKKLHCAESVALFILEFCVGTDAILGMPSLQTHKAHFAKFPHVSRNHELLMS